MGNPNWFVFMAILLLDWSVPAEALPSSPQHRGIQQQSTSPVQRAHYWHCDWRYGWSRHWHKGRQHAHMRRHRHRGLCHPRGYRLEPYDQDDRGHPFFNKPFLYNKPVHNYPRL